MGFKYIKSNLMELIEFIAKELPPENAENALMYIDHNEFGVAFDIICTQIYEYNVPITRSQFNRIESIGKAMQLPEKDWIFLKELITEE